MALSAGYLSALARPSPTLDLWLEIEGVPFALGLSDKPASFWASRPDVAARRLAGLGVMTSVPAGVDQEVRPLDGDSSIGSYSIEVVEDAEGRLLELLASAQRRDGWLRLGSDLPASGASCTVDFTGTADPLLFPAAGGILYLGRETIVYAARSGLTFTGCARAVFQIEGQQQFHAHTAGDVIAPYPRFIATRRASVYAALDGLEANKAHRYAGIIAAAPAMTGLAGFQLQLNTVEAELKVNVFSDQRRGRLSAPLEAGGLALGLVATSLSGATEWPAGGRIILRIDDEYVCGTMQGPGAVSIEARGAFGSAIGAHDEGAEALEVLYLAARDAAGTLEQRYAALVGEHPLEIALQLIHSRDGAGANGPWDTIPGRRFPGLSPARVDAAGILALRDRWLAGVIHRERVEAPFVLKVKLAEILRPVLCYPVQLSSGQLSLRRLCSPLIGLTVREITVADLTEPPTWEADIAQVYGRVVFRCDYDPTFSGTGQTSSGSTDSGSTGYRQTFTGEIQGPGAEAQEFYAGQFQTLTIETPGHHTGLAATDTGAAVVAQRLFETVRDRYAHPRALMHVALLYDVQDLSPGDLVQLTYAALPNITTGRRGLDGVICEVLARSVDDSTAAVALTLAQTDFGLQQRLLSPSVQFSSLSDPAGAVRSVFAHAFTAAGGLRDVDSFAPGDVVMLLSADLATSLGTATIASFNDTSITFAAPVSTAAVFMVPAPYAVEIASRLALWAYGAPDLGGFTGGAAAHTYAT